MTAAKKTSVMGYRGEILSPQWRHFPRRRSQLSTGTRSGTPRVWPQAGHRLRPFQKGSSWAMRQAAQLRKEPSAAPSTAATQQQ